MAQDEAGTAAGGAQAAAQEDANAPRIAVKAQYIQDLSFENPNAPGSLTSGEASKVEIGVNVNARGAGGDDYEITLKIAANAKRGETTVFVLELVYGGLFTLTNVPQERRRVLCLVECPRLLFPFARRIVADATRDGGFPPLFLEPIDFVKLYQNHAAEDARAARAQAEAPATEPAPADDGGARGEGNGPRQK